MKEALLRKQEQRLVIARWEPLPASHHLLEQVVQMLQDLLGHSPEKC